MHPGCALAVEPDAGHARGTGTQNIQGRIVAHMQNRLGRQVQALSGVPKNARIGLGDARFMGAHGAAKKRAQTHLVYIGIAVGQGRQRKALGQEIKVSKASSNKVTCWRAAKKTSKAGVAKFVSSPAWAKAWPDMLAKSEAAQRASILRIIDFPF